MILRASFPCYDLGHLGISLFGVKTPQGGPLLVLRTLSLYLTFSIPSKPTLPVKPYASILPQTWTARLAMALTLNMFRMLPLLAGGIQILASLPALFTIRTTPLVDSLTSANAYAPAFGADPSIVNGVPCPRVV